MGSIINLKQTSANMVRLMLVQLPNSTNIIVALNRIIKAFESPIEIEVTKTRWEEIKKLRIYAQNYQIVH